MKTKDKILEQIRLGNARATGIAQILGTNKCTVSFHVRKLLAEGLVIKSGRDYKSGDGTKPMKPPVPLDDIARTDKLKLMLAILPSDHREEIITEIAAASGVHGTAIDFNALIQSYGGIPFRLLAKAQAFSPDAPLSIADAIWSQLGVPVVLNYTTRTQTKESQPHP